MYSELPTEVLQDSKKLGLPAQGHSQKEKFLTSFLTKYVSAKRQRQEDVEDSLKYRTFLMDNRKKRKHFNLTPRKRKSLSVKEQKELKVFDISEEKQSYDMYLPMHSMWQQYMQNILDFKKFRPDHKNALEDLLKADYHGCLLTVVKSKCPSYVGVTGIVLQETKNILRLVTKENKLKTIPKLNSIFTFELEGYTFTIYGNQFRVNASQRAVRKFKAKPTIDL